MKVDWEDAQDDITMLIWSIDSDAFGVQPSSAKGLHWSKLKNEHYETCQVPWDTEI